MSHLFFLYFIKTTEILNTMLTLTSVCIIIKVTIRAEELDIQGH